MCEYFVWNYSLCQNTDMYDNYYVFLDIIYFVFPVRFLVIISWVFVIKSINKIYKSI